MADASRPIHLFWWNVDIPLAPTPLSPGSRIELCGDAPGLGGDKLINQLVPVDRLSSHHNHPGHDFDRTSQEVTPSEDGEVALPRGGSVSTIT